jgi:hypothetical protein
MIVVEAGAPKMPRAMSALSNSMLGSRQRATRQFRDR